jgi:shikimate kinase
MGHVWLTGMMGTGKSTVGAHVAEVLQVPFVDVDAEITTTEGKTIPEIFDDGEAAFREREAEMVRALASSPPSVVATGGGVVLDSDNVVTMRASGIVVLLTATIETLEQRLSSEREGRPLLGDPGSLAELQRARRHVYIAAADQVIDTTDRSIDAVVREVLRCVDM